MKLFAYAVVIGLSAWIYHAHAQSSAAMPRFVGPVQVQWGSDGRTMKLLSPLKFIDSNGEEWLAPKDSVVDGASIPQFAWSIMGGPFEGRYRDASVIHDVACQERQRPWPKVHEIFYTAMLASGVDVAKAKIMYAAVYHFGPRWPSKAPGGILGGNIDIPPPLYMSRKEFDALSEQIDIGERSGSSLSLAEIRNYSVK